MNKKIRYFLLFGFIIIALYNGLVYLEERSAEYERQEQRKKELEEQQKKEAEKLRLEEEQKKRVIEKDRKERAERVKAFQKAQKQKSPPPMNPAPPPPSRLHLYEVKTICEKRRCSLLTYNEKGHEIYIEVAGSDHSSVSDILNDLIRAGVINFTEHREKFGIRMVNRKKMYVAAYTLRW